MGTQVSSLIDRVADVLEQHPCADFGEFVARVLPVAYACQEAVIVDLEPDGDPPGVIIATTGGWLVVVDPEGIRAGKPDPEDFGRRERPSPRAAVQRKFARPVLAISESSRRRANH